MTYRLRPATPDDILFEQELYATTREDLQMLPLEPAMTDLVIRQQFDAQTASWEQSFPEAERSIILVGTEAIGRVIVRRGDEEIHLVDIALVPEHRRKGIGSRILRDLIKEGSRREVSVRLNVRAINPARRLYRRLGFRETGEPEGGYVEMVWRRNGVLPEGSGSTP